MLALSSISLLYIQRYVSFLTANILCFEENEIRLNFWAYLADEEIARQHYLASPISYNLMSASLRPFGDGSEWYIPVTHPSA